MLLFTLFDGEHPKNRMYLNEGWVIANHILVSFHVAFISSVLSLPAASIVKEEVLRFIFSSPETLASALFMYVSFHTAIAVHELGHYLSAARLNALNERSQREAALILQGPLLHRAVRLAQLFVLAPYGRASGIKREGLNYYPDAPYNLAVAAAGPRASRNLALASLIPAVFLLVPGIFLEVVWAVYLGRLCLGVGVVSLLDFLLADPGKYTEFKRRERRAREKAATVTKAADWWEAVIESKHMMLSGRIQQLIHPLLGPVTAPWQYRNCGMGGRHTEKEYPESNISMQEAMFLILGARDYQEAQEMTVRLQNRLKEIIENQEGCRVMGCGLEGGLAPYIERGTYPLPEVRLWAMMKQTIGECGYQPGTDVAIALDPAMSELEIAYREQFKVPDSIGMYLFWRDKAQTIMDRDAVLELYERAIKEYDIPILSIEDGFSEDDFAGWQNLLSALGDRIFVIGDDLVTTNDQTIELATEKKLINTVLIKANQIGTLYETILAMLVSLGKGLDLVVSHRSKSPNDDMEAQIALAVNALGLKAGGGSNTERLVKYHAVTELMRNGREDSSDRGLKPGLKPVVRKMYAYEEPTNAGVPSVGSTVEFELAEQGINLRFKGATPLGTSAGTGEAIHLVDSAIETSEHREVIHRHAAYFKELEPGVFAFAKEIEEQQVRTTGDHDLVRLFKRAQRYDGMGCLNAVDSVTTVIAPYFKGMVASELTLKDIDRILLSLEVRLARRRGKLSESASVEECVRLMQRKQNLGMNAILSVSLAMARGVAHLQGKDLFEILREEMFAIITTLTDKYGVEIRGGLFSDYAAALQEVDRILTEAGKSLYETLRDLTGIYEDVGADPKDRLRFGTIDEEPAGNDKRGDVGTEKSNRATDTRPTGVVYRKHGEKE
jgi:enolase